MLCDLHTHLLPGVDDGAADLSESLRLLSQEEACGVDTVVLTPHFKPQVQNSEDFLARRAAAFETLREGYSGPIEFRLGAEVLYSKYLANMERIGDFCIEGTDYLLLEMPYHAQFDEKTVRSVLRLFDEHGIRPILAHVERYDAVLRDVSILERFREGGCLFQVNAATVTRKGFFAGRFLKRLVKEGYLDLLGSDCHDPEHRKAEIAPAINRLRELYGEQIVREIRGTTEMVLSNQRW